MNRLAAAILLPALATLCAAMAAPAPTPPTAPAPAAATPEQMQWWRDARFGMFIHWGPVSLTGKELSWSRQGPRPSDHPNLQEIPTAEYDSLYKRFNPTEFNADRWVEIAKAAGMKYMVFTCKHHDGFSNFHTRLSDYNIANSPFKRDIVKELADACHKAGIRFGVYYSTRDWYHPDYLQGDNAKYDEFYRGQVRELLSNYGRVDVMWFDHVGGKWADYNFPALFSMIRGLQPDILINNRAAAFVHRPPDQPAPEVAAMVRGDFDTPEQKVGRYSPGRAWESCMTLVGGQWSWKPDGKMYTFPECINILVQCATGDGNLLLNIGPMPTGEIEPRQVERLKEIGRWLEKFGESIYGTRGGPGPNGPWGGCTFKGNTVYVHVLQQTDDAIKIPALPGKITKVTVLAGGEAKIDQTAEGVTISLPASHRDATDTIIKLDLDSPVPVPQPRS
jgi:alpha-L-fucosidase